ncbi:hypothetical protein IWW39_003448 [Coemansia spiralis]|uniref:HSF-type DNA-binding domain-containing protein n=1 Tax=Coemansia spiralis TaxID=417178 RepID=A0A9W8GL45_9FUNG|nr:hypothetical protein IWW39_003448 [Coemansia spiralis]
MNRKRRGSTDEERHTGRKKRVHATDPREEDRDTDSVSSRTRLQNRLATRNTTASQPALSVDSHPAEPAASQLSVDDAVQDITPSNNHFATSATALSPASQNSDEEALTAGLTVSGFGSIGGLPRVGTPYEVPGFLPTPSSLLNTESAALVSTPGNTRFLSSPFLQPYLVPATTARHRLKKPSMAFKYAIYRIVSNEENWAWIKWNEAGDKLLIRSWDFLINTLIDLGFGATERTSVMKNFYSYGFRLESDSRSRVPDENGFEWCVLKHDLFVRGRPDLLKDIKRTNPPRRQR